MTFVSPLVVFLHILVLCKCCHPASSLDNTNKEVLYGLQSLTIDCGIADHTINITNISVESIELSCSSSSCILSEEQKSQIYNLCNGKNSCSLANSTDIHCLNKYGSFNVSYSCEYVGNGELDNCDFEGNSICGWQISSRSWVVGTGNTPNFKHVPSHDHTKKSGFGHYLFTRISTRNEDITMYRRITESLNSFCISFWYQMDKCGHISGALQIKNLSHNTNNLLWSSNTDTDNDWKYKQISFDSSISGSNRRIFIVARRDTHSECIVALDDILLIGESCKEPLTTNEVCKSFGSEDELEIDTCVSKYTPSDMHLDHTMNYSDCTDDYNKIRSTSHVAFRKCESTHDDDDCNIDISSIVINNRKCFLANRIVVDYVCIGSDETHTITTINQPNHTVNGLLSLTNEHETVYLIVCACIAAIGCIVTFFLICIKRKGICGKSENDNGKMGRDVQVIHDTYNQNKTGDSNIQLDLVYSSPCNTLDESKHRESGPIYAMPSNAYYTANQLKRMENSNTNLVGGGGFAKSMDIYAESVDGVYDTSGSRRHVEDDDNLYNHSVDSVYDHTRAENDVTNNDTYDRTFGNVTERLYDVSRR